MEARLESDHPAFDRWCSHLSRSRASKAVQIWMRSAFSVVPTKLLTRISDMAVVPYRQDQAPRLDFWGSDIRNHTTEGDTLWVNYTTSHFRSRSTVS